MPWKNGGGETIEIMKWPQDGDLSHFDWRISMAQVALDGPFSVFPKIDRHLAVLAGKQDHRHQHAGEAAVEGHAPLPEKENLQRIGKVVARLVEQHVTQPASGDDADDAVEQQVVHLLLREAALRLRADAVLPQQQSGHEGNQVHQAVPAHRERADRNRDGVELGMDEHGARSPRERSAKIGNYTRRSPPTTGEQTWQKTIVARNSSRRAWRARPTAPCCAPWASATATSGSPSSAWPTSTRT